MEKIMYRHLKSSELAAHVSRIWFGEIELVQINEQVGRWPSVFDVLNDRAMDLPQLSFTRPSNKAGYCFRSLSN